MIMLCIPEQLFNSAHTADAEGAVYVTRIIHLRALAFSMYFALSTEAW